MEDLQKESTPKESRISMVAYGTKAVDGSSVVRMAGHTHLPLLANQVPPFVTSVYRGETDPPGRSNPPPFTSGYDAHV
jgi:hypothetical protein